MNDFVRYEKTGRVVTLTLNRPEERNAIGTHDACEAVVQAVQRANADTEIGCLILTGAGTAFCAGGNIKKMLDRDGISRQDTPAATRDNYKRGIQRIPLALWESEVPSIAAVNGPAIGAGCDLACMCDIRIASDRAQFAESFIKVGLVPGDGGAWFLPRIIGGSRAAELTFTGDTIDAEEAAHIGLVSRVVPHEKLLDSAQELAARIAAQPGKALRMSKRLLRESSHARLPELLELSAALQALAHETADHAEAVNAFIEKRPPRFEGQ
jgi:2-(1,2-epoxy-1,2-dihydrophenyl)acetyl-CoA isomerase